MLFRSVDNGSGSGTLTLDIDSTVVTLNGTQTLVNKTLTTPTIGSFVNATHNHTDNTNGGTLTSSAITDFTEASQDAVNSALTAGTGISKTYDDNANTITISNTGVTSLAGTSNEITASASTGGITLSLPNSLIAPGDVEVVGNITVDGNLIVQGTTTTVNTQTYSVEDNMIYLNASVHRTILSATHNTTTVTYEVDDNAGLASGMYVSVTGITPSAYNISYSDNITIDSVTTQGGKHYFTVTKAVAVSYTSGGTLDARYNSDPDLGFAGGYYEGGYAHAGLFRDSSDGKFKFFQGYTPEPDESTTIDTTHGSFALAPIQASTVTATTFTGNLTGDVTGNVSGNAGTVTNGVYTTDTGTVTNTMLAGSISNNKQIGRAHV